MKWMLRFGVFVVLTTLVLGVLASLGVGLSEAAPADDVAGGLVENFRVEAEAYLVWGRWIDLGTALAFITLLAVAPFVRGAHRAKPYLIAGAAIAVVGDLIDLSQLAGIQVAQFSLDNGLATDFTAGNVFRFAIDSTSTYVWVGGLFIVGIGLFVLAADSEDLPWARQSAMLGAALWATAATDIWASREVFTIVSWALALVVIAWFALAHRHLTIDSSD